MSERNIYSPNAAGVIVSPVALNQGGTGATTQTAACSAIGAAHTNKFNTPSGLAQLNADGVFPVELFDLNSTNFVSVISRDGAYPDVAAMPVSTQRQYGISNYDNNKKYVIEAVAGSVYRVDEDIYYTSPATAGTYGFKINGRLIPIEVKTTVPAKPTLIVETTGSNDSNLNLSLVSSAFANYPAGSATHTASEWVVATDAWMRNVVATSGVSTTNKTRYSVVIALTAGVVKNLWCAVRHKDSNGNFSEFSELVRIDSKAHYVPNVEIGCLTKTSDSPTNSFGTGLTMAMSDDGTRLIVSNRTRTVSSLTNAGGIEIYLRTYNTWALEATINNPEPVANGYFGWRTEMDSTGTRIAVSAKGNLASANATGAVYIFTRSGTTWSQEAKLTPSDGTAGDEFGFGLAQSNSFARLLIGAPKKNSETGAAYAFIRSGTTWSQEAKILATGGAAGDQFGVCIASARTNGNLFAIQAWTTTVATLPKVGSTYVFARTNSVYTQESVILPPSPASDEWNREIDMDDDGSDIVIARKNVSKVHLYKRSGTTYALAMTFVKDDTDTDEFGENVKIDSHAQRILISRAYMPHQGLTNAGAVYLMEWNSSIGDWDKYVIKASVPVKGGEFGRFIGASRSLQYTAVKALGANATLTTAYGCVHTFVQA